MSSENVVLVRSVIRAWNDRGDPSVDAYHENAEWDFQGWTFDLEGTFQGTAGLLEMVKGLHTEWEGIRVEEEQYMEAGDKVAFFGHFYARRRKTGLEVSDSGTCIFTIREGKIARFSLIHDRKRALALLGEQAQPVPR
jgi:ketosteroid isomerase-like protein